MNQNRTFSISFTASAYETDVDSVVHFYFKIVILKVTLNVLPACSAWSVLRGYGRPFDQFMSDVLIQFERSPSPKATCLLFYKMKMFCSEMKMSPLSSVPFACGSVPGIFFY